MMREIFIDDFYTIDPPGMVSQGIFDQEMLENIYTKYLRDIIFPGHHLAATMEARLYSFGNMALGVSSLHRFAWRDECSCNTLRFAISLQALFFASFGVKDDCSARVFLSLLVSFTPPLFRG